MRPGSLQPEIAEPSGLTALDWEAFGALVCEQVCQAVLRAQSGEVGVVADHATAEVVA